MFCFSFSGVWSFIVVQYKIQYEVASAVLVIFLVIVSGSARYVLSHPECRTAICPFARSPSHCCNVHLRTQYRVYGLLPLVFHHRVRYSTRLACDYACTPVRIAINESQSLFLVGQSLIFFLFFVCFRTAMLSNLLNSDQSSCSPLVFVAAWTSRFILYCLYRHISRKVFLARIPESNLCYRPIPCKPPGSSSNFFCNWIRTK